MSGRIEAIDILLEQLRSAGVNFDNFGEKDLEIVKRHCNTKDCILWINDTAKIKPVFVNDCGKNYYGFTSNDLEGEGFALYERFLHPDHFDDVHRTIAFFTNPEDPIFRMTYLVKNFAGEWKWTYSVARPISYRQNGQPELVLALVFDIEGLMDKVVEGKVRAEGDGEEAKMAKRFRKLTKREREILHLIADEFTSHEIADRLFIEPSTVDTHRKHIINKLGVKSSIGLVKYSLMFRKK